MKQLSRLDVLLRTLLVFHALLKNSQAQSESDSCVGCASNIKARTTTTTINLAPIQNCTFSIGNNTYEEITITGLAPGTIHQVILNCYNCCKEFTTEPEVIRNLHVTEITTSSVSLSWTEPEGNSSFYRVEWIDGGEFNQTDITYETSFYITGLTAGVQYNVTITAVAGDGLTEGQSTTVSQYTKPEVIRNLEVTKITTSSVSLNWTEPEGQRSFFRVEWTDGGVSYSNDTVQSNITITELTPGAQYTFTVKAVTGDDNLTEGESSSVSQYTKPEVIRNLEVTKITTSSVSLNWPEPEGQRSFFRVEWTDGGVSYNNDTVQSNITITALTSGVQYTFTVKAMTGEDDLTEGESSSVSQYTKPEVIRNLEVTKITTSSVSLNWTEPEGQRSFFRVEWTDGGVSNNTDTVQSNITITALTSGVQYTFTVKAVTGEDDLTEGESSSVSQYTKLAVVRNLAVTEITMSSVSLSWTEPEGRMSFFRVEWNDGDFNEARNVSETSINVTELTSGVKYTFRVIAVAGDNRTEGGKSETSVYTKPAVVRNLTVTEITTSSVSLSWTEPEGPWSFFRVEWTDGEFNEARNVSETSINVTELTSGVKYTFRVIAIAGDNKTEGGKSETSVYTKPAVVRNLTVTEITTSSVSLSWTESVGNSSFYRVEWTDGIVSETENVSETVLNINGLTPGVQHTFRVTAVAGDNRTVGDVIETSLYTKPAVVRNLTVTEITTSSVSLSWTEPVGNSSFNRVEWTDGIVSETENVSETSLNITGLTPGVLYTCKVTAVAGDNRTVGDVIETSLYTKPAVVRNLTVTEITTSSVSLSWTEPVGNSSFYRVEWTDGIVSETENVSETVLNINGLTPGVQHTFRVTAVAGDNRTVGDVIETSLYTKPAVVRNLVVTEITTSSVSLSWTEPEGQRSFFRVEWTDGEFNEAKNLSETSINVTELTSGVKYTFRVIAVAGDNRTEGGKSETSVYTKPAVVRNLTVTEITTSSVSLSWTESVGNSSFYRVEWTDGIVSETENVSETVLNINGLTPGVQHTFRVTAVAGDNRTVGDVIETSLYTKPAVVRNLTVTEITTSSVSLSWTEPEGQRSLFRVEWTDGEFNEAKNVSEPSINVTELTSGVKYTFRVIAVAGDNKTEGGKSETSVYTKPAVVRNLTVTEITTSSVSLSWTEPVGNSSFNRVEWTDGIVSETENVSETSLNITGLTPGVLYTCKVTAVAGDNKTFGDVIETSLYTKPALVRNLTVTEITTSSVSLSWTEPMGNSSFYRVEWTDGRENGSQTLNETHMNITELTTGVQYTFKVIAVAGDDRSEGKMAEITLYTKPEVIRNLTVTDITTSSASLSWTEPAGNSYFYRVEWADGARTQSTELFETSLRITHLTAGVQYTFRVIAVAGDNRTEGKPDEISVYTNPDVIRNFTFSQITTSSVSLKWTEPDGQSSFFIVQWTDRNELNESKTTNETTINVTNLTAGVQYYFTLTAVAGDGNTKGLGFTSTHVTLPDVITAPSVSQTTIHISLNWTKPTGEASSYRVEWHNGGTVMTMTTHETSALLPNLIPGTTYSLQVVAIAQDNETEGAPYTFSAVTKPAEVRNLMVTGTTPSSTSLSWSTPEGNATSYIVRTQLTAGGAVSNHSTTETSITITELSPGFQYNITVIAVAGYGTIEGAGVPVTALTWPEKPGNIKVTAQGTNYLAINWTLPSGRVDNYEVNISNEDLSFQYNNSTQVNIHSFHALQPGRLYEITVTAVVANLTVSSNLASVATVPTAPGPIIITQPTTTSLHLEWATPASMQGAPDVGYSITYQSAGGSTVQPQSSTSTNADLSSLSSGTLYNITVETVGPQDLRSVLVHNSAYTLPNPVLNLRASPESTTSVKVEWLDPEGAQAYYTYRVQTIDTTGTPVNTTTVNTSSIVITGLEPGTRYNFNVTTVAAPGSDSTTEQTFNYTMPKAVTNLAVEDLNTTAIRLSWDRQNDHKSTYSYLVTVFSGYQVVHDVSSLTETYTFTDLAPGEIYSFHLFTVVAGVKSTLESTSGQTKPGAVSGLVAIGTTTNMTVSWMAAAGQVDSYSVLLYRGSRLERNRTGLANDTVQVLFDGLNPGTLYIVMVVTKSGGLCDNSTANNATFPNPPGPITIESQTTDSINISWAKPADMELGQYSFTVLHLNRENQTSNNWLLLENLQSGTSYNISVVTVGMLGYWSTVVMTQNDTRPHSVTRLREAGISHTEVTLVWDQPESKAGYSFLVEATNSADGSLYKSKEVSNTTYTITELLSGSNYTFTITTQTADGTHATPVTVSYVTRPYDISGLEANTLSTIAVRLTWVRPPQYKNDYRYRIETTGCASKNTTVVNEEADISELAPGTNCTFCVSVRAVDGIEGESICKSQYTKPEPVQPTISNNGTNSSIVVSWAAPQGNVEHYVVYLNSSHQAFPPVERDSSSRYYLFDNLLAGLEYTAMVTTVSGPFNATSGSITNATFPNLPGPIMILTKTTNSIQLKWEEAPLMARASFHYVVTYTSYQGVSYKVTNFTNYALSNLISGTPYNISVATVGPLGFKSKEVWIYLVTTRPESVGSLEAETEEESIELMWPKPAGYKESYSYYVTWGNSTGLISDETTVTEKLEIRDLVPGSSYDFNVTTETADGTQGAQVSISRCTNASPISNLKCVSPNGSEAMILLSWTKPKGRSSGFSVTVVDPPQMGDAGTINTACNPDCGYNVSNLAYHTKYTLAVRTQCCGPPSTPVSLTCMTGITYPHIPENSESLVEVVQPEHNKFTIQIDPRLLNDTNGPISHYGVLVTSKTDNANSAIETSKLKEYLVKTYKDWSEDTTSTYLATIKAYSGHSRSGGNNLIVEIGDTTKWNGYTNGALKAKGQYSYAVVLFTQLELKDELVDVALSFVSTTKFSNIVELPLNLAVIGIAVGATLGIFSILFIIIIGFIIYWKRFGKKDTSDIQIHSIRAKVNLAVRVEEYEAYYRKKKADSNCGFAEEFEDLKLVGTCQAKTSAQALDNKPKNRYNNVLPYDPSRVKLSIHGSPFDDYINANYIPGYNSRKEFIAAQGPLPCTVTEFWRMIWEKNVQTLVMLTRCNEQGRVKCEEYWPSDSKHYGNITVTTTSEIPLDDWTIRDFDIKNVKTAETRNVRHFHFTAWPDHGVPETTELLINFRHLVREHMDQYSRHSPTVVHCSAGVGRTGTFIAIDRLIFQIERESIVDVYGVIHDLRMHRPLMVQTEDQYVFLNQCAMDIIRSRTGTNVDLIYQNTAALSIYENVDTRRASPKNGYHDA